MAPHQENEWLAYYELQYRNNTQSRRQNRGLADHDIFEGLPVRNWRRDIVVVAPPPAHNSLNQQAEKWDVELPWGMPKDAHLMPQHSQDLLRAARSGRIYQKRPLMEDDQEDDILMPDKPEKKEVEPKDDGFTVKTWKLVPKHLEGPEFEYLAKRRKGLRGAAVKTVAQGQTMTKMTLRKTDDQGNAYIEHVVVPAGQTVEGEVIAQTVVTAAAATAAADDQPQPIKRRPPPPKRKAKGPGRGRKKKVLLPPAIVPTEAGTTAADGQAPVAPKAETAVGEDAVKQESIATPSVDNEDTEMGDGSQVPSDDEGDEGDEGSEDDDQEEGEIMDDDQEREDEEANARALQRELERERMIRANHSMEHKLPAKPAISDFSMETPGGSFPSQRMNQARDVGGSPLKHTFTPRSYSPSVHNPEDEAEGDEDEDEEPHNGRPHRRDSPFVSQAEREQSYEPQHHPEILPDTASTVEEALEVQENGDGGFQSMLEGTSPDGTEMLLDAGGSSQDTVLAQPMVDTTLEGLGELGEVDEAVDDVVMREDEKFEDLLDGLEEHLNGHEAAASAHLWSRSNSLPEVQPPSVRGGVEDEDEQKAAEDVDVDRMTPAQAAAEAAHSTEEKTVSAETEPVDEVSVDEPAVVEEAVEKMQDADIVSSPKKEEQPLEVKDVGHAEGHDHVEKKDIAKDVKTEAAA